MSKYRFQPDYAIPPGETLQEELACRGMTQAELADRTGMAKKTINEIINGKAPITPDTALKLEHVFGLPAHFWNMLEQNYQETKARLVEQDRLKADLDWLQRFPIGEMIKNASGSAKTRQARAVLSRYSPTQRTFKRTKLANGRHSD